MTIERLYSLESHDVVVFCNNHFGYCVEKGLWEGENGTHDISETLAGDTGGLNQGNKGREEEFDRYIGGKNNKP